MMFVTNALIISCLSIIIPFDGVVNALNGLDVVSSSSKISSRRGLLKQFQTNTAAASLMIGTACLTTAPCQAASAVVVDPSVYNGEYNDPLHPLCQRRIRVEPNSNVFHYSGTEVGGDNNKVVRGCSKAEMKEFGSRKGAFDGTIKNNGRISAGDGIHEGKWEPADSVTSNKLKYTDVDGIRWKDGTKWIAKKEKKIAEQAGEAVFLSYIGFSTLAGVKGFWDFVQEKRQEA